MDADSAHNPLYAVDNSRGTQPQSSHQLPDKPSTYHDRGVSWGQNEIFDASAVSWGQNEVCNSASTVGGANTDTPNNVPSLSAAADGTPPQSPSLQPSDPRERGLSVSSDITTDTLLHFTPLSQSRSSASVTVDDVRKQLPREHEADTSLINAIEQREQADPASDNASGTVLSAVPDEAVSHFTENSKFSSSHRSNRSVADRRQEPSLALDQQLFNLATTMDALNEANNIWGQDYPQDLVDSVVTPVQTSAGEALQRNAVKLYQRMKGKSHNVDENEDNSFAQTSAEAGISPFVEEASSISSHTGGASLHTWQKSVRNILGTDSVSQKKNDDDNEPQHLASIAEDDVEGQQKDAVKPQQNKHLSVLRPPQVFREFKEFVGPQRKSVLLFLRVVFFYACFPLLGISALLFYAFENPPTGILINGGAPNGQGQLTNKDGQVVDADSASASWWLLFVLRQTLTGCSAKLFEFVLVDFMSIQSTFSMQVFGPWVTLIVMQSRGWPCLLFLWGILDYSLLAGAKPFFSHWLHGQDAIKLFNASNPSGSVVDSDWNHRLLAIAVSMGVVVTAKRFWLGLYLGRKTFTLYSDRLAKVMRKIVLITETATLARKLERYHISDTNHRRKQKELPTALTVDGETLADLFNSVGEDTTIGESAANNMSTGDETGLNLIIDPSDRHPLTGTLSGHQRAKIIQLLGAWEEPRAAEAKQERVSVNAILQFRRALTCLYTPYPFSQAFGLADMREQCVESSQEVYKRLEMRSPGEEVNFEVLALLGVRVDGTLDQQKLRDLIRLFRPDRDGSIDILAFAKAIDSVYKEIRLLRASVVNSSKIDAAFENILNVIFYAIAVTIILSRLGFDPLALFLSFSGVVLAFAFMISSASSKYFDGLLFILVRRPYQIGDSIHISNVERDTSFTGSAWWTVEDVNLFETKAVYLFTMERCSLSNGSLANSRIINSSHSAEPYLWFALKFPVDTKLEQLNTFTTAVEQFVKNRPREWLAYADFRAMRVEHSQGFVEYLVGCQHRLTWADWGTIMLSKADLVLFCNELQKQMGIYYKNPPVPIELTSASLRTFPGFQNVPEQPLERQVVPSPLPDIAQLEALIPPRGASRL